MSVPHSFEERYGHPAEIETFASGRVNLLGEHTDYNDGFVLPMAIPQKTHVWMTTLAAPEVRLASAQREAKLEVYTLGHERLQKTWFDYVQGVTKALAEDGHRIGGAKLYIKSNVPLGAGVSSSASLTVATARAFCAGYGLDSSQAQIAQVAYRAEHDFVGVPVGVMDPMAVCLADEQAPICLDTRALTYTRVPLPAALTIVVIDSGLRHEHAGGDYVTRRRECELAAEALGVESLRDVVDQSGLGQLQGQLAARVRHVLTENARVLAAVEAMQRGDGVALGRLFDESHASMRDDYEVSLPAIDDLVAITRAQPGCLGARLTGGGFGGAIVALVEKEAAERVARQALASYDARGATRGHVLVIGGST